VKVRYTWPIFALVTFALTAGYLPGMMPSLPRRGYVLLGVLSAMLLFLSVLVHEASHALVAQARGLRVTGIVLFILGGYCEIDGEADDPLDELLVFLVGPIASLLLAGCFFGISLLPTPDSGVFLIPSYLATINLVLAAVNFVPGLPLDGGRVLRAAVWRFTGRADTATYWASTLGQVFAFALALFGVYMLVQGNYLGGVWNLFIGGFLNRTAASCRQRPALSMSYRASTSAVATGALLPVPVTAVEPNAPTGDYTAQ
jgi:Zn-dependent protease